MECFHFERSMKFSECGHRVFGNSAVVVLKTTILTLFLRSVERERMYCRSVSNKKCFSAVSGEKYWIATLTYNNTRTGYVFTIICVRITRIKRQNLYLHGKILSSHILCLTWKIWNHLLVQALISIINRRISIDYRRLMRYFWIHHIKKSK